MKKFICLFLSLLLFCGNALAEEARFTMDEDTRIMLDDGNWIFFQSHEHIGLNSLPDEDETVHLLWDIPFGVPLGDFAALASQNANVEVAVEKNDGLVFLAVDDPSSVTLFGYPLRQSYFAFQKLKQDIGLTAGQGSGGTQLGYIFAALRLYNGIDNIDAPQAFDCFKTVFDAMCDMYGSPTCTYFKHSADRTIDGYAYPLLNADGSINEATVLPAMENADASSTYVAVYAMIYWSNVKLALCHEIYNYVSISYAPSESVGQNVHLSPIQRINSLT